MLREPPQNTEAEAQVLGAILIDNDVFHRVSDWLNSAHFFDPRHGVIFSASKRLITARRRATPASIKADVDGLTFDGLAGATYLGQLVLRAPLPSHAIDHARTVYDLAIRRELIALGEDLVSRAASAPIETSPDTLIEQTEVELSGLAERGKSDAHQLSQATAVVQAVDLIAAAYQRDGQMAGLTTGLAGLDTLIGGLSPSDLVILAGRPGTGKSALAAGIAYHNARRYADTHLSEFPRGAPVGFFTLEMSAVQIMLRLIAHEVGISSNRLRRGDIESSDFDTITKAGELTLSPAPIHYDESGGINIAQLCARARRMKRQHDIGLLVVDYLQLLAGTKKYQANRATEVAEITGLLKALAKELEIPILALSQLSRQVESRESKRPQLSDLRESGAIEQDADVVMFLYRESYYLAKSEPKKDTSQHYEWEAQMLRAEGKAELLIEKQRQGPTGTVELCFDGPLTRFSDAKERLPVPKEAA